MSLLGRIAESQGAAKAETRETAVDAEVEATRPNAQDLASEGRNAYSQAVVEGADEDIKDEAPTREEQEKFTLVEKAMAEKIYGREASTQIVEAIKSNGDPVKNVGSLALQMLGTMEAEHGKLEEEVAMAILETAVEQMVDLVESEDSSINLNDDQMAEAFSIAITDWTRANPSRVDNEAMTGFASAAAPAQTGGRPNEQVTNENQGAQPTAPQSAEAGIANEQNQPAPIERL